MPSRKSRSVAVRRYHHNRPVRTRARTRVRAAREAIGRAPDSPETEDAIRAAAKELASAARRGVIHPNNAARRTSRLMKLAGKARSSPA